MAINAPASLGKIVGEFGFGLVSDQSFLSGSGTVTAPAAARAVRILAWGGGGGGSSGSNPGDVQGFGGGGGGFTIKTVLVTGGSTQFSYSVGAAGAGGTYISNGGAGGSSTVTGPGVSITSGGGGGGNLSNGSGVGGTTSGGDTGSEAGETTTTINGGLQGGRNYTVAPGLGGNGGISYENGSSGLGGQVLFEWLGTGLSEYTRVGGLVPNHSQNSNIPTTTSDLSVSDFNGAGLNFTAEVTSDGNSGYSAGVYGSISRDQYGTSRRNAGQTTVLSVSETRGLWYDLLGSPAGYAYYLNASVNGNTTNAALGRDLITKITVNGITATAGATHSGGVTTYTQSFPRLESFFDAWAFTNGTGNNIELNYYVPLTSLYQSTTTINSGAANASSGTPITTPSNANFAVLKVWGGGAGGAGGTGGGGGGFATISIDVVPGTTQFYYDVESGGTFGASGYNGGNASISLVSNIFTSLTGFGGNADGTGGSGSAGFLGAWFLLATVESGSAASGGSGGNAGGLSYGGGLGGEYGGGGAGPSGQAPGGGGSIGYAGGGARLEIDWYLKIPTYDTTLSPY